MDSEVDPQKTVSKLVQENPQRARVFEERDVDYCCGGDVSLASACAERDLDLEGIRDELAAVDARGEADAPEFDSLGELADYIVEHHHEFLREELGPLQSLVEKVERVHGDDHPELHEVARAFDELAREIPVHLSEEEQILFPVVEKLENGDVAETELETVEHLLDGLFIDHDQTAEHLETIREATDGYEIPESACPSYEAMLERLEALERDLHMHVHRENHMLFPELEDRIRRATE